jgi:hypothetical protein
LSKAFTKAGGEVRAVSAGKKYLFGCWDAWLTIPREAHTEESRARVGEALEELYQTNNPKDIPGPEPLLIRGMILEWEGEVDAN